MLELRRGFSTLVLFIIIINNYSSFKMCDLLFAIIVNPRRACTARVTVYSCPVFVCSL